jgi:hypothetical protein
MPSNFIAIRSDQTDLPSKEEYYEARGFECVGCCSYHFYASTDIPGRYTEPHRRQARERARKMHPDHPERFELKFDPNLTM